MKYTLWLFLGVLFLPYVAFADVRINEVAWMGTSKSQYSEWIELYNSGEEAVSLAGWKLYKAGNSLMYTLSKSIPSQGYLLIERTTASAPDAVEGVNDESGPFTASGLRNTGEDLVLQDQTGTAVDTLSFSAGWPAGEAASGKTMQWDGSTWITATGTPDAANATVTDVVVETPPSDSSEDTESDADAIVSATSSKSVALVSKVPVPKKPLLTVTVPKNIFRGVSDEYAATFENADTIKNPQGYFYWNMGDGTTVVQQTLSPISHIYQYEGTYMVSVSYYTSPAASKPVMQSTATAMVIRPLASVEAINECTALHITNTSSKTMDLGLWPIQMSEGVRSLPEFTLIAPKGSIIISAQSLGIQCIRTPILNTPDGVSVRAQ